jgi:hypothetical protein
LFGIRLRGCSLSGDASGSLALCHVLRLPYLKLRLIIIANKW